jgi:hypothetical protein
MAIFPSPGGRSTITGIETGAIHAGERGGDTNTDLPRKIGHHKLGYRADGIATSQVKTCENFNSKDRPRR